MLLLYVNMLHMRHGDRRGILMHMELRGHAVLRID